VARGEYEEGTLEGGDRGVAGGGRRPRGQARAVGVGRRRRVEPTRASCLHLADKRMLASKAGDTGGLASPRVSILLLPRLMDTSRQRLLGKE